MKGISMAHLTLALKIEYIQMKFLIQRRITISMLFLALTVLGYLSYRQLSLELLPNAEYPVLTVTLSTQSEMDPAYLESQAVQALEGAVRSVEGIQEVRTSISPQGAAIRVSFKKNVNFQFAYVKLQEKIKQTSATLPENFRVNVQKGSFSDSAQGFITLQVLGEGGAERVREICEQKIKGEFENIDGISSVAVYGGREKGIEIRLNPQACRAHNITASQIGGLLNQNKGERTFVGTVSGLGKDYFVHTEARYEHVSDLEQLVVAPGPILLKDVAEIFFDLKEETSRSRVNGMDAVSLILKNDSQRNIIELSDKVEETMDRLNEELRVYSVELKEQSNTARIMKENLDQIALLALVGGLLAVIVLWFFLRNLRLVLIISLAIPISVLTAFNLFYATGITINSLTLVGMALAIGMLLDNSIVVLENIYRLSGKGFSPAEAVMKGTREVWRSILAATLTTITVFLPFLFTDNYMIRLIGYQIGVSIISTLLISLVVALLFIPMATYGILRSGNSGNSFYRKVSIHQRPVQIYMVFLKTAMRHAFAFFVGAVVLLFASLLLVTNNKKAAMKDAKTDRFTVNFRMHQGSTLESTDKLVRMMEERLADLPEKKELISMVSENNATLTVVLKPDYEKIGNRTISDIRMETARKCYFESRGGSVWVGDAFNGGNDVSQQLMNSLARMMRMMGIGRGSDMILIKGNDYRRMQQVGEELQYFLKQKDFIQHVYLSSTGSRPEIHLTPDPLLLHSYGITRAEISNSLSSLQGGNGAGATFNMDDEVYSIRIQEQVQEKPQQSDSDQQGKGMSDLEQLMVKNSSDGLHPLPEIVSIRKSWGMPTIERVDGEKQLSIYFGFTSANDAPQDLIDSYRDEVAKLIAGYNLPAGVAIQQVEPEDEFAEFRFLILAALLLIFMILASVFESLITPFVLLFTIPLAAIGTLLALYFTDNSLMNTNTLIGMLILLGVVVNNGIILIDYVNILRKQGYRREMALIQAGLSRVRPILITSITTIVALLPMALGKSEYSGLIGAPFAITVIGGLTCSALLTLVLIPTVYMGLENTLSWYRTLSRRIKLLHLVIYIASIVLIYEVVEGLLYQTLCLITLTVLIPGVTYFLQNTLRQASARVIDSQEPIRIHIRNLVKIYERPSRIKREWNGGLHRTKRRFVIRGWQKRAVGIAMWLIVPATLAFVLGNTKGWWIFLFCVTALLALIRKSSLKYHETGMRSEDLKGRFLRLRKIWYQLVMHTPYFGKRKKPFKALRGVNVTIHNGMFGLLGPNGAGKSTMIRIISGILDQSYGSIWINDFDTRVYREELQGLIGYLPQEFGTYEQMSAREFLDYQAILKGITDEEIRHKRLAYVLDSVHMTERQHELIKSFSGGMKQRIGIALILLHLPRILVVDEPTAGLDPRERIRFRNLLVELSKERIVIFSTHIIEDISSSCNQVAVINKGEMKYHGTPNEMLRFAEGLVWTFNVTPEQFSRDLDPQYIVLHIQEGDEIQVRYIAETSPFPGATQSEPNLEDAYLCLLKNMNARF